MKSQILKQRYCLYFSGWNKKGYSIFIGLGREVRISRLALHMYKNVLLKSSGNGVIVNTDKTAILNIEPIESFYTNQIISSIIRGEVCPDVTGKIKKIYNGICCNKAIYPFLIL